MIATMMMNGNSGPSLKKGSRKYMGCVTSKNLTMAWREPLLPREKDTTADSHASLMVTFRKHNSRCSVSKSPVLSVSLSQRRVWVRALVKIGLKTSCAPTFTPPRPILPVPAEKGSIYLLNPQGKRAVKFTDTAPQPSVPVSWGSIVECTLLHMWDLSG